MGTAQIAIEPRGIELEVIRGIIFVSTLNIYLSTVNCNFNEDCKLVDSHSQQFDSNSVIGESVLYEHTVDPAKAIYAVIRQTFAELKFRVISAPFVYFRLF